MPWPPFGFGSGMGVRDVSREEARELGLQVDEPQPAPEKTLNSGLSSSVKKMDPELKKKLIAELRGLKAKDAGEAGRQAALRVRERMGRVEVE